MLFEGFNVFGTTGLREIGALDDPAADNAVVGRGALLDVVVLDIAVAGRGALDNGALTGRAAPLVVVDRLVARDRVVDFVVAKADRALTGGLDVEGNAVARPVGRVDD